MHEWLKPSRPAKIAIGAVLVLVVIAVIGINFGPGVTPTHRSPTTAFVQDVQATGYTKGYSTQQLLAWGEDACGGLEEGETVATVATRLDITINPGNVSNDILSANVPDVEIAILTDLGDLCSQYNTQHYQNEVNQWGDNPAP